MWLRGLQAWLEPDRLDARAGPPALSAVEPRTGCGPSASLLGGDHSGNSQAPQRQAGGALPEGASTCPQLSVHVAHLEHKCVHTHMHTCTHMCAHTHMHTHTGPSLSSVAFFLKGTTML